MIRKSCLIWMFAIILSVFIGSTETLAQVAARKVFFGLFREGAPHNMNYIQKFEEQTGKKPAMIMWYQDWAQDFPKDDAQQVIAYGAIPQIVWEPWYWSDHNKISLKDIIDGKWDSYIATWAKEIKAFGQPIYLRVGHEFNIGSYPWGVINNDKNPELYIRAFRHMVDIYRREGVKNVKWVWCFMNYSYPNEAWNDWAAAYPGNDYVDWVGIDGYNWGTTQSWSDWQALKYLFRDQVRRAKQLWPNKPIMVAEFASAEQGGDKAVWIKEIPAYLKTSMRDIDMVIWFDEKKETDWRINSSEKGLAAFKNIMKDPIFAGMGGDLDSFVAQTKKFERKTAIVRKASAAIKIDGSLSDWDLSSPIRMKDLSFLKEGLDWKGLQDLSGSAYLMWDNTYFYLAATITDANPMVNLKQKQDIWNGDGIEVVMSADPSADPNRTTFSSSDYQIGFSTGNGKDNPPAIWNWQRHRTPTGSEIVAKKTKDGYVIEAKIPWEFFRGLAPSKGTRIGFDIAFDDADYTKERERQFIWNGDYDFYKDPSVWGILELN